VGLALSLWQTTTLGTYRSPCKLTDFGEGIDKLLQEVIRSILEAYYDPQFSDYSHGFRPYRGCQTALTEIKRTWAGTKWFIEGDIKGCFDNNLSCSLQGS